MSSQKYSEVEGLLTPKPVIGSSKTVESYNKMREIKDKYNKLALKSGLKMQNLSIDVDPFEHNIQTGKTSVLNNSLRGDKMPNISTSTSRSKSIDPITKRLSKLPQTTRRAKQKSSIIDQI